MKNVPVIMILYRKQENKMANRKFHTPEGKNDSAELNTDYESAKCFDKSGKLRVGKLGVYYPDMLSIKFVPFSGLERAFIRVHEVEGKLCCGSTFFQYFRLVLVYNGKEIADYMSEDKTALDGALNEIAVNAPSVVIGFEEQKTVE